ncbi:AMIN domain-containing protein [Arcobacter vandammei]|uniref:AMIN domain-containing protein n=1 Tax=Arcobacter vandammei TaxID=2782243 RepID=UPI0018DFE614|nr:AMIN domain-containing protein [Arcobacter vandammei]
MRTLLLSTTLVAFLSLSLQARENPFILYEDKTGKVVTTSVKSKSVTDLEEEQFIRDYQNKLNPPTTQVQEQKVPVQTQEKTYSKKEVDSLMLKTKYEAEQKAKSLVKKELNKAPEQVVYVKPRTDVLNDETLTSKNILPFVKVDYNDNKLFISTEDIVFKKFSINQENKLVIDFKGKRNFSGAKHTLSSSNFKAISTGNHSDNGFYRIVVELSSKPSNYNFDYTDSIVSISKK